MMDHGVPSRRIHLPSSSGVDPRGRIVLAVEALWDEVDAVNDWGRILDVLLPDHSVGRDEGHGRAWFTCRVCTK
jgi:cohesin complex subunit SA-1/2